MLPPAGSTPQVCSRCGRVNAAVAFVCESCSTDTPRGLQFKRSVFLEDIAPKRPLDLPPVLRQTVKTQNPFERRMSHGIVS